MNLAAGYLQAGDLARAEGALRRALAARPEDSQARQMLESLLERAPQSEGRR